MQIQLSNPAAILLRLMLIAAFVVIPAQPAAAQAPATQGNDLFLPLVANNSAAAPAGLYAQLLQRVAQHCGATGLNQICYVNGVVSLNAADDGFNAPGAVADLTDGAIVRVTSTGSSIDQLSAAWLRLRTVTPDHALTILAFGNVQIEEIALFVNETDLNNEKTLPSLRFASSPIAGVDKLGSSGLIVANPAEEDLLSLTLNGAALTLGSTALVEATPSAEMKVTMASGASRTEANGGESTAVQNQQVSVPLDASGNAAGAPTTARELTDDEFLAQMLDELLEKLKDQIALANTALERLNRATDRCVAGQARYIYNVLYWVRVIEKTPGIKGLINNTLLSQAYSRAANCLSFEVVFDSTVNTTHPNLRMSSHLNMEGMPVQFLVDGRFIAINSSLDYVSYSYIPSQSCGPISIAKTAGELEVDSASLQIAGNKVRVATTLRVSKMPDESATISCPPAPPLVVGEDHWVSVFFNMHEDLWQKPDPSFRFSEWKYNGGVNFAEAVYVRNNTDSGFTFDTTTYLILVHTPVQ